MSSAFSLQPAISSSLLPLLRKEGQGEVAPHSTATADVCQERKRYPSQPPLTKGRNNGQSAESWSLMSLTIVIDHGMASV